VGQHEDALRRALRDRQEARRLEGPDYGTDIAFSDYLGVAKATYQMFKTGVRERLGVTLANGIEGRYPELHELVVKCLVGGWNRRNRHRPISDDKAPAAGDT
jgi:hypothetical protein